MAQRGGSSPRTCADAGPDAADLAGTADVPLGFESARRCAGSTCCGRAGSRLMNTARLVPAAELACSITPTIPLSRLVVNPATGGRLRCHHDCAGAWRYPPGNTRMLGAIADHPPFSAEVLPDCVSVGRRKGEKLVELKLPGFRGLVARRGAAEAALG